MMTQTARLFLFCLINFCCLESYGQNPANSQLYGAWRVNIIMHDIGQLHTIMDFETDKKVSDDDQLFIAQSPRNADREIFGWRKAYLGRLFGGKFKNGSFVRITKGHLIRGDSISGILVTPIANYYINAVIDRDQLNGTLSDGKRQVVGHVSGIKRIPRLPLRDYKGITEDVIKLTEGKLYNPALLQQKSWKTFGEELRRISAIVNDDVSFVMGFFYYSRNLPFSHYALTNPISESEGISESDEPNVYAKMIRPKTMYLQVLSFSGTAEEIDKVFDSVAKCAPDTLIIDMRNNSGGSIAAGTGLIRHLITDTVYGGIFLTQKYFLKTSQLPTLERFKSFPHFSEASYDLLLKGISEYDGICLKTYPKAPTYTGKTYVLVNENTASTCEPIVYLLKQNKLAIIVGKQTAGAMLNGEQYKILGGFTLAVPTATYYTADGYKIDGVGVAPNIVCDAETSLEYILGR